MEYKKLLKYAGKNGEYYGQFLERYQVSKEFLSWNWTAFFFLPFLLLYRKLWREFLFLMILTLFVMGVSYVDSLLYGFGTSDNITKKTLFLFMLVSYFLTGLVSFLLFLRVNSLYLKKAEKAINKGAFKKGEGRSPLALWSYIVFVLLGIGANVWMASKIISAQNQSRYSREEVRTVDSPLKSFKDELSSLTYNQKWDEVKVLIEKQDDLSKLSQVDYMFRVIFSLIDNKKEELLSLLLDKKLNIAVISKNSGRDFIKYCYKEKNWKMLKFLMTKGKHPYHKDIWMKPEGYRDHIRPLQEVIMSKDVETLKWLIAKKIPVKAKYYKGETPLMLAVKAESLEMIQLLVDAGANPDYKSLKGESVISLSQKSKKEEIQNYFNSKVSASTFTTAMLNEAIRKEDLKLIKKMLESGMDCTLKAQNTYEKKIPLEVAIHEGNVTILDYLLSHGVDVNQHFGAYNYDAVYESISQNNGLELLRCILKHGGEVNLKNSKHSAIDMAFAPRGDWVDRAKLLVEHNLSLTKTINGDNQLPLHASIEHPDENLTQLIIDRMVKEGDTKALSLPDKYGDTPLHMAVYHKRVSVVKRLLKLGVDAKIMNKTEVQAISYAMTEELLKLLEPYSDHKPSISDSYCMVYVEQGFDKSKVGYCQTTAEYYESIKEHRQAIWYYFLSNDLESVKRYAENMNWIKECNCHGYYAYMDIAHAYLLSGDIKSAKRYYLTFAELSCSEVNTKWMVQRFKVLEGLHRGYGKKAKQLWKEVWQERFKEDFFTTYGVEF